MAKFFETNEALKGMIESKFEDSNLSLYGVELKVMSTKKSKDLITVSKGNPTMTYVTNSEDIVIIQVYEEALLRMDEHARELIIELALSNVWYDTEKDKLNVEKNPYKAIFGMRKKYGNEIIDILEAGYLVIDQIAEEEKEAKQK